MKNSYEAPAMYPVLLEGPDVLTMSEGDAGEALEKFWDIV